MANIVLAVPLFSLLALLNGEGTAHALLVAPFVQTGDMLARIVASLSEAVARPDALTGIVGMVGSGGQYVGLDAGRAARFTILISLNLAVFNLLPLPPLDGGKIAFDSLQRLLPRATRAYMPITLAGWIFVLGLMLYATALDLGRYLA